MNWYAKAKSDPFSVGRALESGPPTVDFSRPMHAGF
jgi:hypothetical protein